MGLPLLLDYPCLERVHNQTLGGTERMNKHKFIFKTPTTQVSSGQSFEDSTFVIYDSRVVL